jgi:hypothetical protein
MNRLTPGDVVRLRSTHLVARIALRTTGPLHAKAFADWVGGHLSLPNGVEMARVAVRELFPSGSCLSRALAVAATVRGAEVVIGVDTWTTAGLSAHAWVEVEGIAVDTDLCGSMPLPDELARLAPTAHGRNT